MLVRKGAFVLQRTEEEVIDDFVALQEYSNMDDLVSHDQRWGTKSDHCPLPRKSPLLFRKGRVGQKLSEYCHWRHRMRCSNRKNASAQEVLDRVNREPEYLASARERIFRLHHGKLTDEQVAYHAVRSNSALLTVTHFRVGVSLFLCELLKARHVLDFAAGWGDRFTGFLAASTVESITLVDPRPGSISGCRQQHALVKHVLSKKKTVKYVQKPAEEALPTLSPSYDLIVTSPPYFNTERYGDDAKETKGQIRHKVSSVEGYLKEFLYPVLDECSRLLSPGGWLALNVDDNPDTLICGPMVDYVRRHPRLEVVCTFGLCKGSGFGLGSEKRSESKAEPVYIIRRR